MKSFPIINNLQEYFLCLLSIIMWITITITINAMIAVCGKNPQRRYFLFMLKNLVSKLTFLSSIRNSYE